MENLTKGLKLIHVPTGRPVRVTRVDEDTFEVVTLDDELGCRWRLRRERVSEFREIGREGSTDNV